MFVTIVDSDFWLDGGAMHGIVPRPLWEKRHPPDDRGRIRMVSRVLLYEEAREGRLWLVEAGVGDGWDAKKVEIYGMRPEGGGLAGELRALGRSPDDVTDVVLTHLHFDHAAGAVTRAGGEARPAFPRARIHVQRRQLEWALRPHAKDAGSYRAGDAQALAASPLLATADGEARLSPTVSVAPVEGHTAAMQVVTIEAGDGRVVQVVSDLVPTFAHLRPAWVMAYDNNPLVSVDEKRAFLARAAARRHVLVSVHDAQQAAVTIRAAAPDLYEAEPCTL